MDSKICTRCKIEKSNDDFYNKYTECKVCISNRISKRYHETKTNYQINENYFMKKIETI